MQVKATYIVFVESGEYKDYILGTTGILTMYETFDKRYFIDLGHLKEIPSFIADKLKNIKF